MANLFTVGKRYRRLDSDLHITTRLSSHEYRPVDSGGVLTWGSAIVVLDERPLRNNRLVRVKILTDTGNVGWLTTSREAWIEIISIDSDNRKVE